MLHTCNCPHSCGYASDDGLEVSYHRIFVRAAIVARGHYGWNRGEWGLWNSGIVGGRIGTGLMENGRVNGPY